MQGLAVAAAAAATALQTDHTDDHNDSDQDDDNDDKIRGVLTDGVGRLVPLDDHLLDDGDAASRGIINVDKVVLVLLFDGTIGCLSSDVPAGILFLLQLLLTPVVAHLVFHEL